MLWKTLKYQKLEKGTLELVLQLSGLDVHGPCRVKLWEMWGARVIFSWMFSDVQWLNTIQICSNQSNSLSIMHSPTLWAAGPRSVSGAVPGTLSSTWWRFQWTWMKRIALKDEIRTNTQVQQHATPITTCVFVCCWCTFEDMLEGIGTTTACWNQCVGVYLGQNQMNIPSLFSDILWYLSRSNAYISYITLPCGEHW